MIEHKLSKIVIPICSMLAGVACGPPAGTRPHDMSIAQHEAAAASEEGRASTASNDSVGWSDATAQSAAEHREMAARHRAAAKALQDAEVRACQGLSERDRDMSPFEHDADIRSVSQFHVNAYARSNRFAGATVVFRAVPGLTAEWLQRIINCHLARNASVGHDMPEMSYCPLVPAGVTATVRSAGDALAVDIQSGDDKTAAEIWRRAQMIHVQP